MPYLTISNSGRSAELCYIGTFFCYQPSTISTLHFPDFWSWCMMLSASCTHQHPPRCAGAVLAMLPCAVLMYAANAALRKLIPDFQCLSIKWRTIPLTQGLAWRDTLTAGDLHLYSQTLAKSSWAHHWCRPESISNVHRHDTALLIQDNSPIFWRFGKPPFLGDH